MIEQRPRIVILEDDDLLREITAFRLELLGYDVIEAEGVDSAMRSIREQLPAAVIMDLAIATADALDVINLLKNNPQTNSVPILAFSTDADLGLVQRAFTAGAADYLVTPYDPATLQTKLEGVMTKAGAPA
jgi:CheY-like chemotaxis protein